MLHGEMGFFTSHSTTGDNSKVPDIKDSTPYGEDTKRYTLSLYGEWEIMEIRYVKEMDLRFALDLTKTTKDSGDFQFSAGMTIKI